MCAQNPLLVYFESDVSKIPAEEYLHTNAENFHVTIKDLLCPHKIHNWIILNRMGAKFQQRNICIPTQKISTSLLRICYVRTKSIIGLF